MHNYGAAVESSVTICVDFLWIQCLFHFRCRKNLHEGFSLLSTVGFDPSESIKSCYVSGWRIRSWLGMCLQSPVALCHLGKCLEDWVLLWCEGINETSRFKLKSLFFFFPARVHTPGTADRGLYQLPICNGKTVFFNILLILNFVMFF